MHTHGTLRGAVRCCFQRDKRQRNDQIQRTDVPGESEPAALTKVEGSR
jgi:hypothetical protein